MSRIDQIKEDSLLSGYTDKFLRQCFNTIGKVVQFYGLLQIGKHGEGSKRTWLSVSTDRSVLEHELEQRQKHDTDEKYELVPITAEAYFCNLKPLGYNEFAEIWMVLVHLAEAWGAKNEEVTDSLTEAKAILEKMKRLAKEQKEKKGK